MILETAIMVESSEKDGRSVVLITGSAGLIGSESVEFFSSKFDFVIGIDNNLREYFFGMDASTI